MRDPSSIQQRGKRRRPAGAARSASLLAVWHRIPRFVPWTVAGLVLVIALSMVVDAAVYANKVHAGVTVAGVDLSGQSREQATATLTKAVDAAQARSVTVVADEQTWEVSPDSVGLKLDLDAAVSAALGATRDSNVFVDQAQKLGLYFGGRDVSITATVDQTKLETVIGQVAKAVDRPAVNAGVAIQGAKVKEIPAQDGLTVDRAALSAQLVEALCRLESAELPVPVAVDEPEVKAEHTAAALAQTKTMVSGPLTLTSEGQSWTFSAAEVARFVDFKTETVNGASTLVPYLSAEKLAPTFQRVSKLMSPTAIDAHFEGDDTKAWVVPSVPGRVLKPEETVQALSAAALKTTGRTAEAAVTLTEPAFTTAEAEAMGIKDLLSERTTAFEGTRNRQNNVRVATAAIDNSGQRLLAPGEEFSYLKAVGDRTPEQGYKEALGIQPNGELDGELGGGICQVATTLFNSVFFAGLKVTERHPHSMYISHYPEGRDAAATTDTDGIKDLRFVNDTQHYIWIRGESDGITTTFRIYGTSDGRKVTFRNSGKYNYGPAPPTWHYTDKSIPSGTSVVTSPGQRSLQVKITRWITWPDGKKTEEVFMSKYPQRPRVVRVGTG